MSASSRPTAWPFALRASARLVATVDLPTPPLPLAMATILPTPGSAIFCGGPGGCIGVNSRSCVVGLWVLPEFAEHLQREDAGIVAVAPDDLVRITAHRRHRHRHDGDQLLGLEDAERIG